MKFKIFTVSEKKSKRKKKTKAIELEYSEVTNAWVGITSANSRVQKLTVVEVFEQYARKLSNSEKIRVRWIVHSARTRIASRCFTVEGTR